MPNIAPTLTGVSGSITFGENLVNATPQRLDSDVSFLDADNNYTGGTLRITGLLAEDRIGLFNQGTGIGQIGVSGSNISYSNITIGSFSGGVGGAFTVTFNASATASSIDALIQQLTYADVSNTPTAARTLIMNVFDAAGGDIEGVPLLTQLTGVNNLFATFTTTQSYILPTGLDFDNDGDMDLAVGTDDGTLLAFRNNGNGSFTQLIGAGVNPFFGLDVGGFSSPAAGDVDNDGDRDLVIGADTHALRTLRNNGDGTFTDLAGALNPFNGLNFNTISQPSAGDFDGDGDTDFIVTEASSTIHSFRNNGDGTFTELTGGANPFAAFVGQSVGSTFVDIDFDGDVDAVMGRANGTLVYGRNNGNGTFTQLTGAANPFNGIDTGSYSSPVFIDVDGDSDLDMISGSSTRVLTTWRNNAVHGVSIIVNVTPEAENSAPTLNQNSGLALNEGASGTITATLLDYNDAEQADTAITFTITSVATNGTLRLSGATLGLGATFTQDDINNNRVTYLHDGGETTSGAFGFSVSDGVAAALTGQSFAFTITPVNDAATVTGATDGSVVEAGGVANGTAGIPGAAGDLQAADPDNMQDAWQAVADGAATLNGYGSFALSASGEWAFTLDDDNAAVQGLNGADTLSDSFVARTEDGTEQIVTIIINAQNDGAILSADTRGLLETDLASGLGTFGTLTISDVDNPSTIMGQSGTIGSYGTFGIGADGAWVYAASSAHDEFVDGQLYTDTFSVSTSDGTATSVTINITGTNDAAILSDDIVNLTETNLASDLGASGTLTISDADGPATFLAQAGMTGSYGTFGIGADGAWTYAVSDAHDGFVDGQIYTDTFSVSATDGTATSVTINITGANDAAILSADIVNLTETNLASDLGASGTLTISDVDSPATFLVQAGMTGSYGTFGIGADGAWTYVASDAHDGFGDGHIYTDVFSVSATDGTATSVTINITGSNDAAILSTAVANLTESNQASDIDSMGTLTNSDVDGAQTFLAQAGVAGTYGTFGISTDGAWTYVASSAHDEFVDGQVYTDTFSVSAIDGTTTSVTINISGSDDAPVSRDDAVVTDEATVLNGSVFADNGSGADSDADGSPTVSAVNGSSGNVDMPITLASGALLTLGADGTFAYDPNHAFDATPGTGSGAANAQAHDSFSYTLAGGGTATVSVSIDGLQSDDVLQGTGGNDILYGGAGDDRYFVQQPGDLAMEASGEGYDRILTSVSYMLAAGSEIEKLTTNDNLATTPIDLTGNELGQYLFGNAGANRLDGGGGADVMVGLGGDDRYYIDLATDRVIEAAGDGYDRVLSAVTWTLQAGSHVDKLTTIDNLSTTAINLTGNNLSQYLFGNAGANILDGGGGGDVLVGLGGDDRYVIRNSEDRVIEEGGAGNDRVFAAASFVLQPDSEVEILSTIDNLGTAAINLTGNERSQHLFGNEGANVLDGKIGNDILYGFGGADTFQFTTVTGANNVDRIADFATGIDRIALSGFIYNTLPEGALDANAFHVGSAAHDADDRIIYNQSTGHLYFDQDGTGGNAAILFATFAGAPTLVASDFMVI